MLDPVARSTDILQVIFDEVLANETIANLPGNARRANELWSDRLSPKFQELNLATMGKEWCNWMAFSAVDAIAPDAVEKFSRTTASR